MEYTVKDRGHYEEITLTSWGEATNLDAVHVMYGDTIGAVILEPSERRSDGWSEDDEYNFRSDVRALVATSFEDEPDFLQFDPGRDRAEDEEWVKRA